jgi:hypothetical protein
MQKFANKYIRLSDISAYLLCPRLAFFRQRHRDATTSPESVRAAIFKELSRSLSSVIDADDPVASLRSHIEVACEAGILARATPSESVALPLAKHDLPALSRVRGDYSLPQRAVLLLAAVGRRVVGAGRAIGGCGGGRGRRQECDPG